MPEPKIERYDVIIPSEIESDTYGNITIKTKDNKEIKVNKKHESLHELIRQATSEGRAVKLGYAVYLNKEYVQTAELFDGKPPVEKQVEPITAGTLVKEAVRLGAEVIPTSDTKLRSMVALYSKDLAVAGKIELTDIPKYADKFLNYILNIK